ncbi:MAG: hypothetical protein ACU83N_09960 [Gammaproteobacteria bacterium]
MKRVFLAILAILMVFGCEASLHTLYGPDATPDQVRDMVYSDAYSVGRARVMWACAKREREIRAQPSESVDIEADVKKAKAAIIDGIMHRIEAVKTSTDPMSALNLYFYNELVKEGASEQTAVLLLVQAAGNRVLSRMGIQSSGVGLDKTFKDIGFDKDLFLYAVGAYEDAIKAFAKTV